MIESFRSHYVYSDGGTCSAKEWNKIIKHYCYPLGVAHEESLVQVGPSAPLLDDIRPTAQMPPHGLL